MALVAAGASVEEAYAIAAARADRGPGPDEKGYTNESGRFSFAYTQVRNTGTNWMEAAVLYHSRYQKVEEEEAVEDVIRALGAYTAKSVREIVPVVYPLLTPTFRDAVIKRAEKDPRTLNRVMHAYKLAHQWEYADRQALAAAMRFEKARREAARDRACMERSLVYSKVLATKGAVDVADLISHLVSADVTWQRPVRTKDQLLENYIKAPGPVAKLQRIKRLVERFADIIRKRARRS